LNQGESYLINGGIQKGGRITATKPVQAHLLIGHTGASYASDWFTLYPVEAWDNAYYTPVGSAASGSQPAYVYLFNPATNAITITVGGAVVNLLAPRITDGRFLFDVTGLTAGKTNVLQTSTNLVSWQSTKTNLAAGPALTVTNPPSSGSHFYRLLQLP